MAFWVLVSFLASALAEDPIVVEDAARPAAELPPPVPEVAAPPASAEEVVDPSLVAGEEILVWGERVSRARAKLDQDLRTYGYRLRRTRDGTAIYGRRGQDNWKPKVLVSQSGVVMFKDPFIVVSSPVARGAASETSESAPGLVNSPSGQPDRGSISIGFPIRIPKQKLQDQEKGRVMEVIGPDIQELNAALAGEGEAKLLTELPARLDRLWEEGTGWEGMSYADAAARRAALLELYATRADTRAGRAARQMIQDFVVEVVQSSPTPLTDEERARAQSLGMSLD